MDTAFGSRGNTHSESATVSATIVIYWIPLGAGASVPHLPLRGPLLEGRPLPDAAAAVGGPIDLACDVETARRLVDLVPSLPTPTWGRDELGVGEMWNSNSVTSWLLVRAGVDTAGLRPPRGATSTPGVWAAGNAADLRAQVITAVGAGSAAAIAINADLVLNDVANAVASRAGR